MIEWNPYNSTIETQPVKPLHRPTAQAAVAIIVECPDWAAISKLMFFW